MTHEISLLLPLAGALPLAAAWARWKLLRPRDGLRIGDRLPDFERLPASDGRAYGRRDFREERALVLVFTANRCPGATAYEPRLAALHRDLASRGVRVVGVNSINSDLYSTESLARLVSARAARGIEYAILRDANQRLARAVGAVCTPHAFVFDARQRLRYHGRIDNAFVAERVTAHYVRDAVEALLDDRAPAVQATPPLGCAIDLVRPRARARRA